MCQAHSERDLLIKVNSFLVDCPSEFWKELPPLKMYRFPLINRSGQEEYPDSSFFFFFHKKLAEALLKTIQKICFCGQISKIYLLFN